MDLNIRDVPEDLHQRLKAKAASRPFGKFIISVLEDSLNIKAEGSVDDSYVVTCPMCGLNGPLVRFGQNARCFHCGCGFMPPEGV